MKIVLTHLVRRRRVKEAQERKLLAEAKFEEWKRTRGMRKMELINKLPVESASKDDGNNNTRVYDKDYKPWRKFMKTEQEEAEERAKREELAKIEAEEKEGREKMGHGIFLEWLAEKEAERKKAQKERRRLVKEEKCMKRLEREAKWMKKAVVNCYGGDIAKEMTSLGIREDGRGGGRKERAWRPVKTYRESAKEAKISDKKA